MANFRKYMVVPFVNNIEKPSESFVENADKNMSDIIKNPEIADDIKMKLYHQNLNKFLLKYDPETYGVTPTLAKLAQNVTDFLERKNDLREENILTPKVEVKQEIDDLGDDYFFDPNEAPINSRDLDESPVIKLKSKESKGSSQKFLDSYEQNINPAASTRSRKLPTHSYGDHGDKSPVKIKAPLDLNIPKFNKNLKISTQSGHGTLTKWGTKKFL